MWSLNRAPSVGGGDGDDDGEAGSGSGEEGGVGDGAREVWVDDCGVAYEAGESKKALGEGLVVLVEWTRRRIVGWFGRVEV